MTDVEARIKALGDIIEVAQAEIERLQSRPQETRREAVKQVLMKTFEYNDAEAEKILKLSKYDAVSTHCPTILSKLKPEEIAEIVDEFFTVVPDARIFAEDLRDQTVRVMYDRHGLMSMVTMDLMDQTGITALYEMISRITPEAVVELLWMHYNANDDSNEDDNENDNDIKLSDLI